MWKLVTTLIGVAIIMIAHNFVWELLGIGLMLLVMLTKRKRKQFVLQ